jgi:membrane-bound acyltransferase YfiQ involved in biofilm formation
MASQSDLIQLQKIKIVQPTKYLMTAAQELLVMMVMTEMALVVVPSHLSHKEDVMSDISLPSRLTSSHTTPRMQTTTPRHYKEFQQVRPMLWLIVLTHILSGLMMSLSLAHIHITFHTFTVSILSSGFMNELIHNFITCVTRTGETLMNGSISHGRNTTPS